MKVELVHVGFDNVIALNRVVAIVSPTSAPIKRLVRQADEKSLVIEMTNGRKTKAVLVLDSGHLALSALQPETIVGQLALQRGAAPSSAALPNEEARSS